MSALKTQETEEGPKTSVVSGYLGGLRAAVPHYGFSHNPVRIDYVMKSQSDNGDTSIELEFTDIEFDRSRGKSNNRLIGAYTLDIRRVASYPRGDDFYIVFYKGAGEKRTELATVTIADPNFFDTLVLYNETNKSRELIKRSAVELLTALAENLDDEVSLERHVKNAQTMQVLAALRQAAVDSQRSNAGWADIGRRK